MKEENQTCKVRLKKYRSCRGLEGIIPIMLGVGSGAETRVPMAFAIVDGGLTLTMLTLFVVPVCYTFIKDRN